MYRPLASFLFTQMHNSLHWHERILARFLKRRGWVVFYLEEYARDCNSQDICWLKLYKEQK